jgi:hypothetical protein
MEDVWEKALRLIAKKNTVSVVFIFLKFSFTIDYIRCNNCRLVASKLAHNGLPLKAGRE